MAQVRRELDAMARRTRGQPPVKSRTSYRLHVGEELWARAIERAPEGVFHTTFEVAARWAAALRGIAQVAGLKAAYELPFEERAVLLLVELLLREPVVRNRLGMASADRLSPK